MLYRIKETQTDNYDIKRILESITHKTPLTSGKTNTTYLATTTHGRFFIKEYNPTLTMHVANNEVIGYDIFSQLGFVTPTILTHGWYKKKHYLITTIIPSQMFLTNKEIQTLDAYFIHQYLIRFPITSSTFGGLIQNDLLYQPSALQSYAAFIRAPFLYFAKKIYTTPYAQQIGLLETQLYKKIKTITPVFYLQHGDIAPKHLFMKNNQMGIIDLEQAKFADISLDAAVWLIRTLDKRSPQEIASFLRTISALEDFSFELFLYHIYRELFIQSYYTQSLDNVLVNYKNIASHLI